MDEAALARFAERARVLMDAFLSQTSGDFYEDDAFDYILENIADGEDGEGALDAAELLDALMPAFLD